MTDQTRPTALAKWICAILQEGIVLTDGVSRFLEATFGTGDLAAVLAQADDSEIDSLIELLCYPEFSVQIRFESRWGNHGFTADDPPAVVNILCSVPLQAEIVSPSGSRLWSMDIPPFALEAFVQRLNITWRPPQKLAEIIENGHCGQRGYEIRVRLRNARIPWNENQIDLMARFLARMTPDTASSNPSLDFLISILSELTPAIDPYEFLISCKFKYFQSLCHAREFERKRLSSNMEIMILQGARAAHGSIAQWRHNMRQIDLICQTLFGRTHFFQQPGEHCVVVDQADTDQKIQDVIRLLS